MTTFKVIRSIISLVTVFFIGNSSFAQRQELIALEWKEDITVTTLDSKKVKVPHLTSASIDRDQFLSIHRFNKTARFYHSQLESYTFEDATATDLAFIKENHLKLTNDIQFNRKTTENREKTIELVYFSPYLKVGNKVKRVTQVAISFFENMNISAKSRDYVANSVLRDGSGSWYKISVSESGIYKIDKSFLESIGINTSNLNPNHINIYGNGFGLLPENNAAFRPDDLTKNAIEIIGGNDNSFDANDKIIFYAQGPHRWERSGSYGFTQVKNIYSEVSTYFININPNAIPKRVEMASTTISNPTITINTFDDFSRHERDLVNITKGGQRWFGEEFDVNLTQNFSFDLPNIPNATEIKLKSGWAHKFGGSNSTFTISNGNTTLFSTLLNTNSIGFFIGNQINSFSANSNNTNLTCTFNRLNPADILYLDFLEINAERALIYSEDQMDFRHIGSVSTGGIAEFVINNYNSGLQTWEITEHTSPKRIEGSLNSSIFSFKVEVDSLRQFVTFNQNYLTPLFVEKINPQNLHGLPQADNIIITNSLFINQAERLANLHREQGLTVHVVTINQVYNEFSSGMQDATAIKTFAKMFFDRANGNPALMPKYLTLFGDATYDPKNRVANNNYMVPTYHFRRPSNTSINTINNLPSDDYFGLLGDNESIANGDDLDIGVGRILATTAQQATEVVNKIEHYMKNGSSLFSGSNAANCDSQGFSSTQGAWRMKYSIIADDRDDPIDTFIPTDAEPAYEYVKENHFEMNANKIYLDAYQQQVTAGGQRYPDATEEINRNIENGNILMTYVGHGGESGAAQERVIGINQINEWTNIDNMPLFVSATCEFTKYDDNDRISAGEWMHLNPNGGAIALMTTTRSVYFGVNTVTNKKLFENVFTRETDGSPLAFGEIIRRTKNEVSGSSNKRSFTLIGDPALKIALPTQKVVLDSINNFATVNYQDTIKALARARMTGHLEDQFGNILTNVNGILEPSIYDKPKTTFTLGQDEDFPREFEIQKNILYRGRVTVNNGYFSFDFIAPKDIDYNFGKGKASLYAYNENTSAGGFDSLFYIGGISTENFNDVTGPELTLTLNNENFADGGITNETPILIATLFDENGINTAGSGIGHDITATIDGNTADAIILNEFYEADLDTYQSGKIRYQLPTISPGKHTLTLKAWDVINNSAEISIDFIVQEEENIVLDHVLNYPNPFTTKTDFYFEHNQVCNRLKTQIEIFTVTGRLIRTINEEVKTSGFRSEGITWDGRDEFGDQLAKGVYVYKITVENEFGDSSSKIEKLYLLK
ncbi:MAG: type IX secretion system sortase PorU [Lishizhenia sp.]